MITLVDKLFSHDSDLNPLHYQEIYGTSDDTKPVGGLVSGSKFIEIDTGDVYFYNQDASPGSEWVKQFSLQD